MGDNSGRKMVLVTGGCRSGKSAYAQRWAEERGPRRAFLATARAWDQEMAGRIKQHQEGRGRGWITVEEPLEVSAALSRTGGEVDVVLLDCLTLWINNLMLEDLSDHQIAARARDLAEAARSAPCSLVMVGNEVGLGIVPDNPEARRFRDLAGMVGQTMAGCADELVLTVAGYPLQVKG